MAKPAEAVRLEDKLAEVNLNKHDRDSKKENKSVSFAEFVGGFFRRGKREFDVPADFENAFKETRPDRTNSNGRNPQRNNSAVFTVLQ